MVLQDFLGPLSSSLKSSHASQENRPSMNFYRRSLFYVEYLFLRFLAFFVNLLSFKTAMRLAEIIGSLLFLRPRRRQISLQNLHAAFPEKSEAEIKTIGRASMQNLVKTVVEFIRIPKISRNPERFIETEGEENVWEALRGGKGMIFVASHFGNWELMAIGTAAKGFPMHAIGRPVKNPFVYEYIKRLRGATGLKSINQKGAVRATIRLLKQNQVVGMLVDQHAKRGEVWVNFFGRRAATSSLPALLSLKVGSPVLPIFFYRRKSGCSILAFGRPFRLIRTGRYEEDLIANTQQYVDHLQEEIRKRPADWGNWMHNRWRPAQPPAPLGFYGSHAELPVGSKSAS